MPIYEYKCPECNKLIEFIHYTFDPEDMVCLCGAKMFRLMSVPGIRFQGKGFHSTDYGK